jgi:hypothetical protein
MNRPYCIRPHLSYGPVVELGGRIENEKLGCGGCRSLCLACFGNPVDLERVAGLLVLGGSIDPLGGRSSPGQNLRVCRPCRIHFLRDWPILERDDPCDHQPTVGPQKDLALGGTPAVPGALLNGRLAQRKDK